MDRFRIAAACAAGCLGVGLVSIAVGSPTLYFKPAAQIRQVDISDVDPQTVKGAETVKYRIFTAANDACSARYAHRDIARGQACMANAIADANLQLAQDRSAGEELATGFPAITIRTS